MKAKMSPCVNCTRVMDPENCTDKKCGVWRGWFLEQWELLRGYPRRQMDAPAEPAGVNLGGSHYAAPHQVLAYLKTDPCEQCASPKDLCVQPCRTRRQWGKVEREVTQ